MSVTDGSVSVRTSSAEATRAVGARLAALLRAGDLVLLTGALGAGKTTLAQGLGAGLGVRGPVTSPTFVIARVHPSLRGGPPLVHVDAYRVAGWDELEDLDLEATLDAAVTVVEWGEGVAEGLADGRLEIVIEHVPPAGRAVSPAQPSDGRAAVGIEGEVEGEVVAAEGDARCIRVRGVGRRWAGDAIVAALGRAAAAGGGVDP